MVSLKLVTYCGLHCQLCAQRGRIPRQADLLRESMRKEGYELWGKELSGFESKLNIDDQEGPHHPDSFDDAYPDGGLPGAGETTDINLRAEIADVWERTQASNRGR